MLSYASEMDGLDRTASSAGSANASLIVDDVGTLKAQFSMLTELHEQSVSQLSTLAMLHMQRVNREKSSSTNNVGWGLAAAIGVATVAFSTTALLFRSASR